MAKPQPQPPQAQPAKAPEPKRPQGAAVTVAKPAVLPEAEGLYGEMKLGRPRSAWRFLNRAYAWATREISLDEWELICETVRKHLDGREMYPEDAASWAKRVVSAMCEGAPVSVAVPSCDQSDLCILVVHKGKAEHGLFFSRSLRLRDPKGLRKIGG